MAGERDERIDGRSPPLAVMVLARATNDLEQDLQRIGADQLVASARMLAQFEHELFEALLKDGSTLLGRELTVIKYGLLGLRQANEQVDAHDEPGGQSASAHDLDQERRTRRQQIDRVQEPVSIG